jgi:hypothetical protein
MKPRYAEEANYWDTTVAAGNSQGEIIALLDAFGAESILVGQGNAGGRFAWMVRFHWSGASYRFVFMPLQCAQPDQVNSYSGKRRTHTEQAKCQMGRIAVHFVKAILTAAEAQPGALFGFMELPEAASGSGMPPVAAELDISTLIDAVPLFQLPSITLEEPNP